MRRVVTGILLGIAMLAGGFEATLASDSALSRIIANGELRVGTTGTQPPFSIKSRSGELMGYEIDLADLLASAMGVKLTLVEMPFKSLLDAVASGEVDVVMSGMTMTPKRNLRAAFVGPYIISGKSILTKDATIAKADEAGDIDEAGLTIAVLANSTSQEFVEDYLPAATMVTFDAYDEGVQMVLDDRATLMVADYPVCVLSVLRHADKGLVTLTEPLTIEPIGIAISPQDPLLLNLIQNYLGALEAVGLLAELESAWFDDAGWLARLP